MTRAEYIAKLVEACRAGGVRLTCVERAGVRGRSAATGMSTGEHVLGSGPVGPDDGDQSTCPERGVGPVVDIPEPCGLEGGLSTPSSSTMSLGVVPIGVCLRTPSLRCGPYMVAYPGGLRTGMGRDAGHSDGVWWRMLGFFQHVVVGVGATNMAQGVCVAVYSACTSATVAGAPKSERSLWSRSRHERRRDALEDAPLRRLAQLVRAHRTPKTPAPPHNGRTPRFFLCPIFRGGFHVL